MPLNWKSVTAEHIRQACRIVAASQAAKRASGIVIWYNEHPLPAKEVQRVAYRIANNLSEDTELKFSSGDSTLTLLSRLGFRVERTGVSRRPKVSQAPGGRTEGS
jgi:hypothetical protein